MDTRVSHPAHTRWTWIIAFFLMLLLLAAWLLGWWQTEGCCQRGEAPVVAAAPAPAVVSPPAAAPAAAPEPAPVPPPPPMAEPKPETKALPASAPQGLSIALKECDPALTQPLAFALGSYGLTWRHKQQLQGLAQCLKASGTRIEVAGHTDNTGNPDLNLEISTLRAQRVAAFLIASGMAKDQVTAKGYGEVQPVADNGTPVGRRANRRLEFVKQ